MRFDDRLDTVLAGDVISPRGRASMWRQCADLLCQDGQLLPPEVAARLLRLLSLIGREVDPAIKDAYAIAAAPYCAFLPLITLLAKASPVAARAFAATARLDDAAWLSLVADLGPAGRAVLRGRTAMSPTVRRAIDLFAHSDFALPAPAVAGNEAEGADVRPAQAGSGHGAVNIGDLVRRIEEYRERRGGPAAAPMDNRAGPSASDSEPLRFQADASGRIVTIEGAPRGRFVGLDLSQPARAAEEGCDAATARRFSKRSAIAFGRLLLMGEGPFEGTWLCHAEPMFDPASGSFLGYNGTLRRPSAEEMPTSAAANPAPAAAGPSLSAELLRTMLHELRSPLNAISGYAQMIRGQYAGPVSEPYRAAADVILTQANALAATIRELDLLSQDPATGTGGAGAVDLYAALNTALTAMQRDASPDIPPITVDSGGSPPTPRIDLSAGKLDQLLALYLHPLAFRETADGAITVTLGEAGDGGAVLRYRLPAAALMERQEGVADRPGLGFAHDRAAALARDMGGSLAVAAGQYILNFPALGAQMHAGGVGA